MGTSEKLNSSIIHYLLNEQTRIVKYINIKEFAIPIMNAWCSQNRDSKCFSASVLALVCSFNK